MEDHDLILGSLSLSDVLLYLVNLVESKLDGALDEKVVVVESGGAVLNVDVVLLLKPTHHSFNQTGIKIVPKRK